MRRGNASSSSRAEPPPSTSMPRYEPHYVTASTLRRSGHTHTSIPYCSMLKTGVKDVDELLGGGLRTGMVTELCGEAGSGKTHFALQCCFAAQRNETDGGLNARALYICSETYPAKLVARMAQAKTANTESASEAAVAMTDDIIVAHMLHESADELVRTLARAETLMDAHRTSAGRHMRDGGVCDDRRVRRVRLVVVDSIASLFRTNDIGGESGKRWNELYRVARMLKELAHKHDAVVLVVNQVTDVMSPAADHDEGKRNTNGANGLDDGDNKNATTTTTTDTEQRRGRRVVQEENVSLAASGHFTSMGRKLVPALGPSWAGFVNCRLVISLRTNYGGGAGGVRRQLAVAFAPHLPNDVVDFVVTESGVACGT